MELRDEIRRSARHVAGPAVGILVVGYFLVHMVQGDRGILAWVSIRQQIARAEARLAVVEAERARLERHVALLRSERLDPDMLDEQARRVLGLVGPRDIVVFEGPRRPGS
jgi:cell division protein FtsB